MPDVGYNSKIVFGSQVLMDLTADTVEASKLLSGYTAHGADGAPITGTCTYDADTSDATATADEILSGSTAYKNGSKLTGTMVNRGAYDVSVTDLQGTSIPVGYHDGSGVASIDSTSASLLIPQNIRQNIEILGVTGTMSGSEDVNAQAATATPYTTQQVITPDSSQGYNYLSQVTINAISYSRVLDQTSGGYVVTIGDVAPASA